MTEDEDTTMSATARKHLRRYTLADHHALCDYLDDLRRARDIEAAELTEQRRSRQFAIFRERQRVGRCSL